MGVYAASNSSMSVKYVLGPSADFSSSKYTTLDDHMTIFSNHNTGLHVISVGQSDLAGYHAFTEFILKIRG
jgi:hypothetical protein